jgi:Uma2 family endonuclease
MATEVTEWPPIEQLLPQVELVAEDGEPMESTWHLFCTMLLIQSVNYHLRGRNDYYAAGNQFIYFSEEQARNRDFRGPDFYLVLGVPREPMRQYWCVWQEGGRYPNVIIELLSPTTARLDRTVKKEIYEGVFRTPEYFCFDPNGNLLEGWQSAGHYEPIQPNEHGWLWCDQLALWLGAWRGRFQGQEATWLRFYDTNGELVLTGEEAAERTAKSAQFQAQATQQQAQAAQQRADSEKQRADSEKQRAEQAEAELTQLKAQLAERESQRKPQ